MNQELRMSPPIKFGGVVVYRYKIIGKYIHTHYDGSVSWKEVKDLGMTLSSIEGVQRLLDDYIWTEIIVRDLSTNEYITKQFKIVYGKIEEPKPAVLHLKR